VRVEVVIPVKGLRRGKSRLRDAVAPAAHADLVLALAADTAAAAATAPGVSRVLAVTSDTAVAAALRREGIEVLTERPPYGLNRALRQGETALGAGTVLVGALQADLPALRPAELGAALSEADGRRACCVDRHGTGTTLLLSAPGQRLEPAFGAGSADAHRASGATELTAPLPSLRCDVDTAEDLRVAAEFGLGPRTLRIVGTGRSAATEAGSASGGC
jgi:2-phospho-L-lactate guanylyltransferase